MKASQARSMAAATCLGLICAASPAPAQEARVPAAATGAGTAESPGGEHPSTRAVSTDVFLSTDADNTDVYRVALNADLSYRGPEEHWGIRFERGWYRPLGERTRTRERGFLRYADRSAKWAWTAQVGTDGHTVIGSVGIHNEAPIRTEFFLERDLVETRMGLDQGIYYTFAGAAVDLPADKANVFTLVGGIQEFTGDNMRLHARVTYTHVLKENWGLSLQFRGRYYHSTHPGEFDYYSPRWYLQALPVLQMRRYSGGWRYMVAAGVGGQKDANSGWVSSRFAAAEVASPMNRNGWYMKIGGLYSNTPLRTGIYDYGQVSLSLLRTF